MKVQRLSKVIYNQPSLRLIINISRVEYINVDILEMGSFLPGSAEEEDIV